MNNELELRELRDDELDLVSAGIHRGPGLVTVIVRDIEVEVQDVNVSVNALSNAVVLQR
ncbi:hypothetical protein NKH36_19055 [Mesorhizobium sp. M1312]|uniref:hypothetical protein n=1 Tax=unclassified Mesorhizobium TaxID=325217 RepID=UPI00333BDED9